MKLLILLLIAFTFSAHALEYNDVLPKVNVIKSYNNNFLVINRGLEDGIFKGDHIKLTNTNGYIARAICIKTSMLISHWKVYRVVNPDLLSYDDDYKLRSMNQSKVPSELEEFKTADFDDRFNDISDEDVKKPVKMQQNRIVKFDLSLDTKKDPILEKEGMDETDEFMDRNFDGEQFKEDFSKYNITLSMAPISWQRENDQRSINYGIQIQNQGEKYEFSLNLAKTDTKTVDAYSKQEITSESTEASMIFDINRITKSLSYFMFLSYAQAKEGKIYAPRRQVQGGILGLKYHIAEEGDIVKKFDISYITILDYVENDEPYDIPVYDEFGDEIDSIPAVRIRTNRRSRHSFRLRLNTQLTDSLAFNTQLWYKPVMFLETQKIDWLDTQTEWTSSLQWSFSEKLSASFEHVYTYDITQLREYQNDPMNQTNALNLNYVFDL